jgi:hypothetical protein
MRVQTYEKMMLFPILIILTPIIHPPPKGNLRIFFSSSAPLILKKL